MAYSFTVRSFDRKLANQQNGWMKTTLDLPDDLVKEVKLRAVHEGRKLKDEMADLLRKGLAAGTGAPTSVKADRRLLKRRAELTRKFISGEWGVELAGFEAGQAAEGRTNATRSKA
jgi:plasmid stability protein